MKSSDSKDTFRFPARSGLQAGWRPTCDLFRIFSLLFSFLFLVSIFMLFLSILGSILVAKIDEKSTKNDVIFLIVFWRALSSIFLDFWFNVVNVV